jgi:transcriptional regulator with XRE-family HTH domain
MRGGKNVMDNNITTIFPERLKTVRKNAGLSQIEFAKKLGITRQSVSYYENGERLPDIQILTDICKVANCSPNYLLGLQDTMQDINADISAVTGLSEDSIEKMAKNKNYAVILNFAVNTNEFWTLISVLDYLARININLSPKFGEMSFESFFEYCGQIELNKLMKKAKEAELDKGTLEEMMSTGAHMARELEPLREMFAFTSLVHAVKSKVDEVGSEEEYLASLRSETAQPEQKRE